MVSTRSVSRASSSLAGSAASLPPRDESPSPAARSTPKPRSRRSAGASSSSSAWYHAPDTATLAWLAISLPLVIWDTGYVLGRPYTMEGGVLHWPLWAPYKLYGEVDYVYGWKAFNAHNGFTAAQGAMNAVETAMYLWYVWLTVGGGKASAGWRGSATALLVGFSAAVMTLSKTFLYWFNEYYSGFDNIGHNSVSALIFLWIIPNGAWLVGSTWMIYKMGSDIIDGLTLASRGAKAE